MSGGPHEPAVWAAAFARSSAFAALAPLAGSGAVPKAIRAVLAVALTPAVATHVSIGNDGGAHASSAHAAFVANAAIGAAFGFAAAAVAAAASSAGALVDATFASNVVDREAVFGGASGPFGRLFALAFGAAFLGTGAMTHLCERFVAASSDATMQLTLSGIVALTRASCNAAVVLAAPALLAQALGTIAAAFAARAAPRVNGLMLSSPLIGAILLPALFASAPILLGRIAELARAAALVSLN